MTTKKNRSENRCYFIIAFICVTSIGMLNAQDYTTPLPHGHQFTITSKILDEDREIQIYTPKGFWGMDEKTGHYPVIYVLDGESQFLNTVAAVDYLSAAPLGNDKIPRSIVVGIPNTNRNRDLSPPSSQTLDSTSTSLYKGDVFADFISEELIPFIDSSYSTTNHRTIVGHSLGGLFAFQLLLEKRELFDHYIALDPAFFHDNESYFAEILETLEKEDLSNEKVFVATANSIPQNVIDIEKDTSQVSQIRRSTYRFEQLAFEHNWNIDLKVNHYSNEDHFSIPFKATYDAFRSLYSYYPFPQIMNYYHPTYKDSLHLVDELKEHYAKVSSKLKQDVIPMLGFLNSWAFGMDYFKRPDMAMDLFDYAISLYPNDSKAYTNKAYYAMTKNNKELALSLFEKSLLLKKDPIIEQEIMNLKND